MTTQELDPQGSVIDPTWSLTMPDLLVQVTS